jgi:hypothetical protein
MKPWVKRLIKSSARGASSWMTAAFMGEKLLSQFRSVYKRSRGEERSFIDNLSDVFSPPVQFSEPKTFKNRITRADKAVKRVVEVSKEELGEIMEKKKRWSFFKVVLFLGMLIAVAVFLLDKILPKPYRDEELDEAWNEDVSTEDDKVEEEAVEEEAVEEEKEEEE